MLLNFKGDKSKAHRIFLCSSILDLKLALIQETRDVLKQKELLSDLKRFVNANK